MLFYAGDHRLNFSTSSESMGVSCRQNRETGYGLAEYYKHYYKSGRDPSCHGKWTLFKLLEAHNSAALQFCIVPLPINNFTVKGLRVVLIDSMLLKLPVLPVKCLGRLLQTVKQEPLPAVCFSNLGCLLSILISS